MTTYRIPAEPTVDPLWIDHPEHGLTEVRRATINPPGMARGWFLHGIDATRVRTWAEILSEFGAVSSVHPDLEGLDDFPAPWATDGPEILDGVSDRVDTYVGRHPALAQLIVRAVNEYVERRAGDV